jgi:lysyl-tRNA synthetase class 2
MSGESIYDDIIEVNDQTQARLEHLNKLKEIIGNVYPNKFQRSNVTGKEDTITAIVRCEEITKHIPEKGEDGKPTPEANQAANAELNKFRVRVSGRIATPPRIMGKAAFVHLSDGIERLQIYVRKQDLNIADCRLPIADFEKRMTEDQNEQSAIRNPQSAISWEVFNLLDHGDFIGVEGYLFVTKTGELSVHVETLQFLSKALLPMPDKMHGIHDPEIRQRQRYADLIASSLKVEKEESELTTREVFEIRSKAIRAMRNFLDDAGYIEVETPMLTPKATGAIAKPFITHHNALDITLYARIAPELYLKRLTVGGFEKVYELNRNFRNEGISHKHNPEFTMLEFYCAYMDAEGMMDFCEELLRESIRQATGGLKVKYEGNEIDFSKFERISMMDAAQKYAPTDVVITDENLIEIFETHAEHHLIQPTFVIDHPKAISPLSKASPQNPTVAERFELYIAGMECANGFSELNDPQEQYERFLDQLKQRERGDEEAMVMDEDYIRALAYGMPPAAGIGIGIDRMVMLLTNKHSIRDVILFPHHRPERKETEEKAKEETA